MCDLNPCGTARQHEVVCQQFVRAAQHAAQTTYTAATCLLQLSRQRRRNLALFEKSADGLESWVLQEPSRCMLADVCDAHSGECSAHTLAPPMIWNSSISDVPRKAPLCVALCRQCALLFRVWHWEVHPDKRAATKALHYRQCCLSVSQPLRRDPIHHQVYLHSLLCNMAVQEMSTRVPCIDDVCSRWYLASPVQFAKHRHVPQFHTASPAAQCEECNAEANECS